MLPTHFRSLSKKEATCYGPNCFNFALIGHGVHKHTRAVAENELAITLGLFCRDVSQDKDGQKPGDIGLIRERLSKDKLKDIHAFNFIKKTVATKNGEAITATLTIQDIDSMFSFYHVDQKCRNPQSVPANCIQFVSYFRCDPAILHGENVDDFEALEERLARSLYNKDLAGELSSLEEMLELMKDTLSPNTHKLMMAKIESIEYQLKRMQPLQEEFLIDVVKNQKTDLYAKVHDFLRKSIANKKKGKNLPYIFNSVVNAILQNKIAEFYDDLKSGLPFLSPTMKKKVRAHLVDAKVQVDDPE